MEQTNLVEDQKTQESKSVITISIVNEIPDEIKALIEKQKQQESNIPT